MFWLVAMATEWLTTEKCFQKIISSKTYAALKLQLYRNNFSASLNRNIVFMALILLQQFSCYGSLKLPLTTNGMLKRFCIYCYVTRDIVTKFLQKCF